MIVKLILAGINTSCMTPSIGVQQFCLNLVFGPHQAMVWFLAIFVTFWSDFGLISRKIMVWFRSDLGQWWSYFIFGITENDALSFLGTDNATTVEGSDGGHVVMWGCATRCGRSRWGEESTNCVVGLAIRSQLLSPVVLKVVTRKFS